MTEGELRHVKLRLDHRRAQLVAQRDEARRATDDVRASGLDTRDRVEHDRTLSYLQHLTQFEDDELRAINTAMVRMAEGVYGICVRCGEEIDEGPLRMLPATPLCTACADFVARETRGARAPPRLRSDVPDAAEASRRSRGRPGAGGG